MSTNISVLPKNPKNNKTPFNQTMRTLTPNKAAELLELGHNTPGILSLAQGQGDKRTPDFITNALTKAMQDGETFYGPTLGRMELRTELENYYQHIYNLNIPSERIFITPSGTTAMHIALTAILDKGDEVVALTPIWKNLLGAVELAQGTTIQVPLDHDTKTGWSLDLDRLFDACTPRTKALLITTPSNPTGWCMSHEEMKQVLDFARKHNIWIISDEVYARTMYGHTHAPSFHQHVQEDDLLLTINSFSKSWAMTGWRMGWLTAPPNAAKHIENIAMYGSLCPPSFSQFGAIAALKHGEPFLKEQIQRWESNRDLMMERLGNHPRIQITKPEATFYTLLKIDGEPDDFALCRRLIEQAKLSLAPGSSFGLGAKSTLRLSFAISEPLLREAFDRLESIM